MNQYKQLFSDALLFFRHRSHLGDRLQQVLSRFFDILYRIGLFCGGIAFAVSIWHSFSHGWYSLIILHTLLYCAAVAVLIFRRHIPAVIIFFAILLILSIHIIHSLSTLGLAGTGFISLIFASVFAGIFLGIKAGLIAILAGSLMAAFIGTGICTGIIVTGPDLTANLTSPAAWIIQVILFVLYSLPLIVITSETHQNMASTLKDSQTMNEQLQQEIVMRKTTELALAESEEKYRNVVECSLAAFYIIQDNLFRFVNNRFCVMLGYHYEEIVNKLGPLDIIHPEDAPRIQERLRRRANGDMDTIEGEFMTCAKDGSIVTTRLLASPFIYNGKPAACGTVIDISKEKTLESQLRQSQKMEAIGQLTGGIAHDFNNILTALTGFSSILQKKMDPADPLRHYTDQILSASQKAVTLTSSLLTFGRRQPVALKPLKINELVKSTEKLLRRLITEDITLSVNLHNEDITIMADATQIDQILFNLTANARDAMPKGGTLTITTKRGEIGDTFITSHGFGTPGKYVLMTVSDTGYGMDRKTQEKVFDPFFTTKDLGKGTGLGLSTVYGIVKQHNGYITLSSKPDAGTIFRVYIPEAIMTEQNTNVAAKEMRRGCGKILIAEDNEDVRLFMSEILSEYGYSVIEAVDGEDAIAKFQEHGDISLVILDSIMPNKNGKEAYEAIKKNKPDVKTLFMSGYTNDIISDKGVSEEDLNFIAKPLAPDIFLAKIEEMLDNGN